jgi:hypothetical protein
MMSIPSEVIEISSEDSLASSPPAIKKDPSPVIRRGKQAYAQHIPSAAPSAAAAAATRAAPPGKLQLGQAVKEKQHHQDLVAARGKKTGIESTPSWVHFSIGLRWCIFDEFGGDEWHKPERDHSLTIDNTDLTTADLIRAFRRKLYHKIRRPEVRSRLKPEEDGEWFLSHTDPTARTNPQEIDTWDESQRLSSVIERGIFGYKKIIDGRKQYNLWLCWLPKAPAPTPIPTKKSVRKEAEVKKGAEPEVKQEIKQEVTQKIKEEPDLFSLASLPSLPSSLLSPLSPSTPTPAVTTLPKRPRAVSEISTPPRAPKQAMRKGPAKQAESNVRTRKQKEGDDEPLLEGIKQGGRRRRGR